MSDEGQEDAKRAALNARLEKLDAALRKAEDEQAAKDAPPPERKGFSRALRVAITAFSEFVGAVIVGGLIGWKADEWLGTAPWLLIATLGIGVVAGFWNVYRVAKPNAPSEDRQD
jgi:ATP synthase protein I